MTTSQAEYYRGAEAAAAALAGVTAPAARARAVHTALQPLLAPTLTAACRAGCAHCCLFPVGVTFAEAQGLATAVAARPDLRARVLAAAAELADRRWVELVGQPCPLLDAEGHCTVYDARPLPCRALASADADACARSLHADVAVPRDERAFWRGLGAAAELGAEEPGGARELRSALAALLCAPASAAGFATARPVG